MNCIIPKSILQNMLSKVQGFTEKKSTLPILSHVLLEAYDSYLRVKATDLHTSIQVTSKCDVKENGSCAINGKSFFDVIRELPDDMLHLWVEDQTRAHIDVDKNKIKMNVMDPEEYPMIEFTNMDKGIHLDLNIFKPMIDRTIFSIPSSVESDSKYTLGGSLLTTGEEENGPSFIEMVTTDSKRLSVARYDIPQMIDMGGGIIVPKKGMQELKRLIEAKEEDASILLTNDSIFFVSKDTLATVRLIDGKFPEYKNVTNIEGYPNYTRINAQELLSVLKVCAAMVSDISNCVRFSFTKDKTIVYANNPDQGEIETPIKAEHTGEDIEINFNPRYFIDSLSFIQGTAEIRLKSSQGPCLITDMGETQNKWVIMPMRF